MKNLVEMPLVRGTVSKAQVPPVQEVGREPAHFGFKYKAERAERGGGGGDFVPTLILELPSQVLPKA